MKAGTSLRTLLRKTLRWVMIYAIALNGLTMGLQPSFARTASTFDAAIICQSGGNSSSDNPDRSGTPRTHTCDHCVLCSAIAAPAAPDVGISITFNVRPVGLQNARNAKAPLVDVVHVPELPRGPPQMA
jgi:hypothetical protein